MQSSPPARGSGPRNGACSSLSWYSVRVHTSPDMTMTAHSGQTLTPLLELADIHYAYREGIPALSGISLSVYPGERIAVLGANGCGKSTLLKLMGGLIFPQSGSSRAFGRRQMNGPPEEIRSKVRKAIELFGIGALKDRAPYELSGGEKRKVAIASMMVMDPQVLLLDEPTAGLDPRSSRALVDAIIEAEESGKTVVTATHDLHVVSEISRRVLVFGEDRRILASGTPEEILTNRSLLLSANLVHLHRHAHEDYWHAHEHEHPEVFHIHEHHDGSPQEGKERRRKGRSSGKTGKARGSP